MAVVYPIVLTIVVNQILSGRPSLGGAGAGLEPATEHRGHGAGTDHQEGSAGGQTDPALLELATRGSSPLLGALAFCGIKGSRAETTPCLPHRRHCRQRTSASATAALEFRQSQPLSAGRSGSAPKHCWLKSPNSRRYCRKWNPVLASRKNPPPHGGAPAIARTPIRRRIISRRPDPISSRKKRRRSPPQPKKAIVHCGCFHQSRTPAVCAESHAGGDDLLHDLQRPQLAGYQHGICDLLLHRAGKYRGDDPQRLAAA